MNASEFQTQSRATIEDLMKIKGKAELIGGKVIHFPPAGYQRGRIVGRILRSLDVYSESTGFGEAFGSTLAYRVPELPSGRESCSPDASLTLVFLQKNRKKYRDGFPIFAVEVRSESDFGPSAERDRISKREDYFAAGTKIVWDVEPDSRTIFAYYADSPATP